MHKVMPLPSAEDTCLLRADDAVSSHDLKIPHIIKYMGSKKPILEFVVSAIDEVHRSGFQVCDLFTGSCSVAAALRKKYNLITNDIQSYSEVLARTYFSDLANYDYNEISAQFHLSVVTHVKMLRESHPQLACDYRKIKTIGEYQKIEAAQRKLLQEDFAVQYHLFTRYYSGTYWSFDQCVWIDALRKAAEGFKETPLYWAMLSSLMYAMSYTTQSTGHFAQYRDGTTEDALKDILIYRTKNLYELFTKKLIELLNTFNNSLMALHVFHCDYEQCLSMIPEGTTVYADPPYAPVHYSRFYHALETLVQYDYPEIDHKGRYRIDRHQSPFSRKSDAVDAFRRLFAGIVSKHSPMVLSYSGTGVVKMEEIIKIAREYFTGNNYDLQCRTKGHLHSTMGRAEDKDRDVIEYLLIAKLRQ